MPTTINGLPTHILIVHAVVILVPLAALMLGVSAVWPAARRKLGILTPGVAFAAMASVPVATDAGEWLQERLPPTDLIAKHAEIGDSLSPFVILMFLLSAAVWWLGRRADEARDGARPTLHDRLPRTVPSWTPLALAVLGVVVGLATTVQVVRIGDSGAQAAWHGVATTG